MKRILKKGIQIGVLTTAVAAGSMLLSGCQQPTSGGNTIENSGNTNGGNTNGGNEQTDKTYGTPYTKTIGNGNYTLHNYIGDDANMQPGADYVTKVNSFLKGAETYNKGLVNNFETSLANRPAAQNYFYKYTNAALGNEYNNIENSDLGGYNFDSLIDINNFNSKYIFTDIIKNLPTFDERYAFRECYRILANESYKEGLGTSRYGSNSYMTKYQNEKESIASSVENGLIDGDQSFQNINLEQEYGANNFANITNLLDSLIRTATNNMNQSASLGLNGALQANDLRQIINLTTANKSLTAVHDRTANNLTHNSCVLQEDVIKTTMTNTIEDLLYNTQSQNMELSY